MFTSLFVHCVLSLFVHWHHSEVCFTSRTCGEMFGSREFSFCTCVSKSYLDCLALEHLWPLTWLSANSLGLWFHFSLSETLGCGLGWLFSTLSSSINLALESKACSLTSDSSLSGWACFFLMQGISFLLDMPIKKSMWPAELLRLGDGKALH